MVSSSYYLVPSDFNESNSFGVAGFETNGCTRCDVEAVAVGFEAVEGELGVGFDKVVMGANLPLSALYPHPLSPITRKKDILLV